MDSIQFMLERFRREKPTSRKHRHAQRRRGELKVIYVFFTDDGVLCVVEKSGIHFMPTTHATNCICPPAP